MKFNVITLIHENPKLNRQNVAARCAKKFDYARHHLLDYKGQGGRSLKVPYRQDTFSLFIQQGNIHLLC